LKESESSFIGMFIIMCSVSG